MYSLELGYDGIEICIDMNPQRLSRLDWTSEYLNDLKNFLEENEINLKTLSFSGLRGHTLGQLDSTKNKESIKMVNSALKICKTLEIEIILINAYDVYYEKSTKKTTERFKDNLKKVINLAEKYQVTIGLENAEKDFADTASKVNYWVELMNSPYLKIYYDSANAYNAFEGDHNKVVEDFKYSKHNICSAHLKDSTIGEYRMTPYGKGQVQFNKIIPLHKKAGIKIFTAELFKKEGIDWRKEARDVKNFLTKCLKGENIK